MELMKTFGKAIVGIGIAGTLMYGGHKIGPGIEARLAGVPAEKRISVRYECGKTFLVQNGAKKSPEQFSIDTVYALPIVDQQAIANYIVDHRMNSEQKLERIVGNYNSLTVDDQNKFLKGMLGNVISNMNPFRQANYPLECPLEQTRVQPEATFSPAPSIMPSPSASPTSPAPAYAPQPMPTQTIPTQSYTPSPSQQYQKPAALPAPSPSASASVPTATPSASATMAPAKPGQARPSPSYTTTPITVTPTTIPMPTLVPEK